MTCQVALGVMVKEGALALDRRAFQIQHHLLGDVALPMSESLGYRQAFVSDWLHIMGLLRKALLAPNKQLLLGPLRISATTLRSLCQELGSRTPLTERALDPHNKQDYTAAATMGHDETLALLGESAAKGSVPDHHGLLLYLKALSSFLKIFKRECLTTEAIISLAGEVLSFFKIWMIVTDHYSQPAQDRIRSRGSNMPSPQLMKGIAMTCQSIVLLILHQARDYATANSHLVPRDCASLPAEYKFGDMRTLKSAGMNMSAMQAIDSLDRLSSADTIATEETRAARHDPRRVQTGGERRPIVMFKDVADPVVIHLLDQAWDKTVASLDEAEQAQLQTSSIKEIIDGTDLSSVRMLRSPSQRKGKAPKEEEEEEDNDGYKADLVGEAQEEEDERHVGEDDKKQGSASAAAAAAAA